MNLPDQIKEHIMMENHFLDLHKTELEVTAIKKIGSTYMAIAEIDGESFSKVMNQGCINVGWSKCYVYEIVVYEQLNKFLEDNNILVENQSGFRKNHSTETVVLSVVNECKHSLDQDFITVGVFLDLSRAFETINRP